MHKLLVSLILLPILSLAMEPDPLWQSKARESIRQVQKNSVRMTNQAKQVVSQMQQVAFQTKQGDMQDKIKHSLRIDDTKLAPKQRGPIPAAYRPVLFVSSSMPLITLRRYAYDLEKVGGAMILRGGVGGLSTLRETLGFSQKVLTVKTDCVQNCKFMATPILIDPILFKRYQIDKVPALVLEKSSTEPHCKVDFDHGAGSIVYGDASLRGMLDELNRLNPRSEIREAIEKL